MWEHRKVIELAPYHGAAACAVIIINPFHFFFIDCEAKTSTSVTAHLALHPFFFAVFFFFSLKGSRPKNHIFTGKGAEICSLSSMNKLSRNNARQCQQEPD